MKKLRILYAEDEPQLSMAVAEILKMEGYEVDCAYDGAQAWDKLKKGYYDAAVLDIMMPKMDGMEVLKAMRDADDFTPVLMLTAKTTTDDRVEGLNVGADDYLGKPFVMKELLAHLKSMLRRSNAYKDKIVSFANVTLDCETGEVKSDRGSLRLSGREGDLLALLLKHPEYMFTVSKLSEVLGNEKPDEGAVLLYISYLKNKLGQIKAGVEIVPSEGGYCLKEKLSAG